MPDKSKKVDVPVDHKGNYLGYPHEYGFKKFKLRQRKGTKMVIRGMLTWHVPNKPGMGRSKGNTHERETALMFSFWIYGEAGILKRTPLSGGWASGKAGDIILDHEMERKGYYNPPIYVECRSYKDLLQHNLLTWIEEGTPKQLTEWVEEVEAKCDGRMPMLVLKGKGTKPYLLVKEMWICTGEGWPKLGPQLWERPGALRFNAKDVGKCIMLPLEQIGNLGDGEVFLKRWETDGGPTNLRNDLRHLRKRKGKKGKH